MLGSVFDALHSMPLEIGQKLKILFKNSSKRDLKTLFLPITFLNKIFNFGSLCTPQVVAKLFEFQPLLHQDSLGEPHGELQLGSQLKRAMSLSGEEICFNNCLFV